MDHHGFETFTDTTATSAQGHFTVFTGNRQAEFLKSLQLFGNVRLACRAACVSAQTAYRARHASRGFALAWDAACLAARNHAEATLADRAINGVEEAVYYHGEEVARRRRFDSRLLLAHLARLDRLEARAEVTATLSQLDACIAGLGGGAAIDDILCLREKDCYQDSVPPVPSCRVCDAKEAEVAAYNAEQREIERAAMEAEAAGEAGWGAGEEEGEDGQSAEGAECDARFARMDAARPEGVPGGFALAERMGMSAYRAYGAKIDCAQLEAFEAGVERWWEVLPKEEEEAEEGEGEEPREG